MNLKVLIADLVHNSLFENFQNRGWQYDYLPDIQRTTIKDTLSAYHGLIIRSKTSVDADLLQNATQLKFIARAGAGLDLFDLEYLAKKNIEVFTANEGNRDAVAEHVVGMLLTLFNKINTADAQVRQKIWLREENRGEELCGKTVALIGYGNNGQATAQRLSGFGVKVIFYDQCADIKSDRFATQVDMNQIFEQADVLSLHIPLSTDSNQMVKKEFLDQFKKPIYLVNIARGEIVNLTDLYQAIQSGKVKGACLDVLENEKLAKLSVSETELYDKLFLLPNIIFTPHIAGWSHQSYIKINEVLVEKIEKWLTGR